MIPVQVDELNRLYPRLRELILDHGHEVDVGEWHAQDVKGKPELVTHELTHVLITSKMPEEVARLMDQVEPNLPWAEEHFRERVGGEPLNPPPSHVKWPWASHNEKHMAGEGKAFSHSYPERMWPTYAYEAGPEGQRAYEVMKSSNSVAWEPMRGLRFMYGDLNDLIEILKRNPYTRQAYLPIWFPEDLNAAEQGERVPCTLGYHFMVREGRLHLSYFIRSCDLIRYFRDDVYMAIRLAQWVRTVAFENEIGMGQFSMFIGSLHVFKGDLDKLRKQHQTHIDSRLLKGGW